MKDYLTIFCMYVASYISILAKTALSIWLKELSLNKYAIENKQNDYEILYSILVTFLTSLITFSFADSLPLIDKNIETWLSQSFLSFKEIECSFACIFCMDIV